MGIADQISARNFIGDGLILGAIVMGLIMYLIWGAKPAALAFTTFFVIGQVILRWPVTVECPDGGTRDIPVKNFSIEKRRYWDDTLKVNGEIIPAWASMKNIDDPQIKLFPGAEPEPISPCPCTPADWSQRKGVCLQQHEIGRAHV